MSLPLTGNEDRAVDVERGWLQGLDLVLTGTRFAQRMIAASAALWPHDVAFADVGYPIVSSEIQLHAMPWEQRPRRVVFPHRLAPEKQPHLFKDLQARYEQITGDTSVEWVTTRLVTSDKDEFYRLLGSSRVAVSFALQN